MKLEILNNINNQCVIVQKSIAQTFGEPENETLINELQRLLKLLKEYLEA